MDTANYLTSLPSDGRAVGGGELVGPVTEQDTPWDPSVARAIGDIGKTAYDEALLAELLDDIALG